MGAEEGVELIEHTLLGGAGTLAVAQEFAAGFHPGKFVGGEAESAQLVQMLLQFVEEEEREGTLLGKGVQIDHNGRCLQAQVFCNARQSGLAEHVPDALEQIFQRHGMQRAFFLQIQQDSPGDFLAEGQAHPGGIGCLLQHGLQPFPVVVGNDAVTCLQQRTLVLEGYHALIPGGVCAAADPARS